MIIEKKVVRIQFIQAELIRIICLFFTWVSMILVLGFPAEALHDSQIEMYCCSLIAVATFLSGGARPQKLFPCPATPGFPGSYCKGINHL